jgi:hypothetical protein
MNAQDFELAVVFPLVDLARVAGMDKRRLRRLLESGGIRMHRLGGRYVVCRVDLRDALPAVYEAILQRVQALEST